MDANAFPVEHLDLDRLVANLVDINRRRKEAEVASQLDEDPAYWTAQADQLQAEEDLLNQLIKRKQAHEKE